MKCKTCGCPEMKTEKFLFRKIFICPVCETVILDNGKNVDIITLNEKMESKENGKAKENFGNNEQFENGKSENGNVETEQPSGNDEGNDEGNGEGNETP